MMTIQKDALEKYNKLVITSSHIWQQEDESTTVKCARSALSLAARAQGGFVLLNLLA